MKLTDIQKANIKSHETELRELKSILHSAKTTGTMPKGKAHLFSRYANMGLIDLKAHKVVLTPKGKRNLSML